MKQQRCMGLLQFTAATVLQAIDSECFQPSTPMDASSWEKPAAKNP